MTDQANIDEAMRRELELAYLVCALRGPAAEKSRDVELDVTGEYLRIHRLMSEKALPSRVASSVVIRCTIQAIELEESSRRYLITFLADGLDKPEVIRSDRTDGRRGAAVMSLWRDVRPGTRALIYKHNENQTSERANGYRVAPYVIVLSN